jgi:protein ImuA
MSAALHAFPDARVWTGRQFARPPAPGLPTGFAALDAQLPGGGWPRGSITELLSDSPGLGEIELLLPLLARATPPALNLWIAPPWLPYAPALASRGLALERMLVVRPATPAATLWATRQALASSACHAVLAWLDRPDMAALRRLQLAAEDSGTPLFLFRPLNAARQPSPASLRLQLSAAPAALRVDILKRRGPTAAAPVLLPLERPQKKPGLLENRSERLGAGGVSQSMLSAAAAGRVCKLGRGAHGAQDARPAKGAGRHAVAVPSKARDAACGTHTDLVGEHPSTAQRSNPTAQ